MTTPRITCARMGWLTPALMAIALTPLSGSGQIALESCAAPGVDTEALCGHLVVWEDREAKSGRQIELSVMVLPASGTDGGCNAFLASRPDHDSLVVVSGFG